VHFEKKNIFFSKNFFFSKKKKEMNKFELNENTRIQAPAHPFLSSLRTRVLHRVDEDPNYEYAVHLSDVNEMCCLFSTKRPPYLWIVACCDCEGNIRPIWALDYDEWHVCRLFVDQGQYNIYIEYSHRRVDDMFVHRIQRVNGTNESFKYPGKICTISRFLVPPYRRDQSFLVIHPDDFFHSFEPSSPKSSRMFKFIGEDRVCALDKDQILRGQSWERKMLHATDNRMDYCPLYDLILLCTLGDFFIVDASKGDILKEYHNGAPGERLFDKAWWDQLTGDVVTNLHSKTTFSRIEFSKMFPGGLPKHQFDVFDKKALVPGDIHEGAALFEVIPEPAKTPPVAKASASQSYQCVVCLELDRDCIFLPCRHVCCCKGCTSQMKQCPICKGEIKDIQSVFLS
jgi:hypothetical protein